MELYKFTNKEGTAVLRQPNLYIVESGYGWKQYLRYTEDGGLTDPYKSEEEIYEISLEEKIVELKAELDTKANSSKPNSNSKSDAKVVARLIKLVRKESQGRASTKEIEEIDLMEALDNYLDAITDTYDVAEIWLEAPERTIEEIESYDVVTGPGWPQG